MKFGQNVYFTDRNLLKLSFLIFSKISRFFPIFPWKLQFWVNFSLKFGRNPIFEFFKKGGDQKKIEQFDRRMIYWYEY